MSDFEDVLLSTSCSYPSESSLFRRAQYKKVRRYATHIVASTEFTLYAFDPTERLLLEGPFNALAFAMDEGKFPS